MSEQAKPIKLLLPLDLQFFSTDFDLTQVDQWMQEHQAEQRGADDNPEPDNDEILEDGVEEVEEDEEVEEVEEVENPEQDEEPQQQNQLPDDEQKRNAAFAEMRRQNQELARQAAFIKSIADQAGMTVEELQQQWEADQLAKRAEQEGVPVEVLQRQAQTDQELAQLRQQVQGQRVNAEVAAVKQKYSASDDQIQATIDYALQNGMAESITNGAIPFEAVFKIAHMDSLIEDAKKGAVQQNLAAKKQRQKEAPVASGGGTATVTDSDLDEAAEKRAKELIEGNYF